MVPHHSFVFLFWNFAWYNSPSDKTSADIEGAEIATVCDIISLTIELVTVFRSSGVWATKNPFSPPISVPPAIAISLNLYSTEALPTTSLPYPTE